VTGTVRQGPKPPAYLLGMFPVESDKKFEFCSRPTCRKEAQYKLAFLWRNEIFSLCICETCGAEANSRPIVQCDWA
jgi:hypothetical protein